MIAVTACASGETPRNILWNSSFECGVGSGSWGVVRRVGPNVPELWHQDGWHGKHSLNLVKPVGSRLYKLGDKPGVWRLSMMARRISGQGKLTATLTNRNHYSQKREGVNAYQKGFTVGEEWKRIAFDSNIRSAHRPYFHIELNGTGVLVDAIMLFRLEQPDEKTLSYHAVQDVETGVVIPEITKVYTGNDERLCFLMVANNISRSLGTQVGYTILDVNEEPVRGKSLKLDLKPQETRRIPLSLEGLHHSAYRIRSTWRDGQQKGGGLVGILPKVRQDYATRWGCNASLGPESLDFTIRVMKKLGMGFVSTQSTGQFVGGWHLSEPEEGRYVWHLDVVKKLKKNSIEPVVYMYAARWPKWVAKTHGKDETKIAEAYGRFVHHLVKVYSEHVKFFVIQDETERQNIVRNNGRLYRRMHVVAYEMAKKAAKDNGHDIFVSTNT
ncbi:MAG: hypothetical protein QF886_09170, partial [Planctomycetota bacterium]|nr:hypothetical protein [Planctomycetota bacterium]